MSRVRVAVLGPTVVSVDDAPVHLTPRTVRFLLRLVAAEGEIASTDQLYLDLWGRPPLGVVDRPPRTQVQQCVTELRHALEPGRLRQDARFPRSVPVLSSHRGRTAYQLRLDREELDCLEFTDLINRAATAPPATAVALLTRALALWRGQPLMDVAHLDFAAPLARRLRALHKRARLALVRHQAELGDLDAAVSVVERLAAEFPEDAEVDRELNAVRQRVLARSPDDVARREFPGLGVTVVVRCGDFFEHDDANLVVGFGDTFDTDTRDDAVVSRGSVQGQLLDRLYRGDRRQLDKALTRALAGVEPLMVENGRDKPKGKRRRYAIGTVAPLLLDGRRVFGVVHCRQDLRLVTHSSPGEFRHALERLWISVREQGLLRPVAIPLVGAGLSRVGLSDEQLMIMIIDTFLKACVGGRCAPELRVILRKEEMRRVRISDIERFMQALDNDGNANE